MITQGPFSLTIGTALALNDPGANSNHPATAIQLQNASPFIIEVNSGGIVLTIQSFTAQTVPTSGGGQPLSVVPIQSNSGGGNTAANVLTVAWLLAGESAPMLDGPLTAAAIAFASSLNVNNAVVSIDNVSHDFTGGSYLKNYTATANFLGIRVTLVASSLTISERLSVTVTNNTSGQVFSCAVQVPPFTSAQAGTYVNAPISADTGDSLTIVIALSGTGAGGQVTTVVVIGLGAPVTVSTPLGQPLANYPVGGALQASSVFGGAGSATLLAAPKTGFAYRLHRWNSNLAVTADVTGLTSGFLYGASIGGVPDNLDGQLVTEGIVALVSGATTVYLTYDLVTTPQFIG